MPAPDYGSYAAANSTGDSVTCNVPTGTTDGDFLVAMHRSVLGFGDGGTDTLVTPSGWTLWDSLDTTAGIHNGWFSAIYYKVASSEPASYDFDGTNTGADKRSAVIVRMTDVVGLDSDYVPLTYGTGSTVVFSGGELTPTVSPTVALYFGAALTSYSWLNSDTSPTANLITADDTSSSIGAMYHPDPDGDLLGTGYGVAWFTVQDGPSAHHRAAMILYGTPTFNVTGSGTFLLSGDSSSNIVFDSTGSGEFILSGEGLIITTTFDATGSGAFLLSANPPHHIQFDATGSGEFILSGDSSSFISYDATGSGTFLLSGDSTSEKVTWSKARPLKVKEEYITRTLYNFPVTVVQDLDTTGDDESDLLFTRGSKFLDHHVDSYVDGVLSAIVKLDLDATADNDFTLHYGKVIT